MALRWCTRRSKLTPRCALLSRLVFALDAIGRDALLASADGFPKRRGRSSGAERLVPVSDAAALVESRGVASDIRGCQDGVWARIQDLFRAWSFLRRRRMTMASFSMLQFMLKTFRSFERSGCPPSRKVIGFRPRSRGIGPTGRKWLLFAGRPDLDARPSESHLILMRMGTRAR